MSLDVLHDETKWAFLAPIETRVKLLDKGHFLPPPVNGGRNSHKCFFIRRVALRNDASLYIFCFRRCFFCVEPPC